jgi:hypothetical protein
MGRWTTSEEEKAHLGKIIEQRTALNGVVALKDGRTLTGAILLTGVANDNSGRSQGDLIVRVESETGQLVEHRFDVLDVAEIMPVSLN